ncbi:MAG TPA: VCBS repeat-containing protein [Rubrivivax sp.]|nr:VCBS repeat-containing protein [Rubrivivax sp.]
MTSTLRRRGLGWVALASIVGLVACGGGSSQDPGSISVQTDVAVADVDGDGRADVLTLAHWFGGGQPSEGRLIVYRQILPGVFAAPESHVFGCYPWAMTLADIDGDGRTDLVVADPDDCPDAAAGRAVHLLLQDAARPGRFLAARTVLTGTTSYHAAVDDFNGDGAPDIVVSDSGAGRRRLVLLPQDAARRGQFLPAVDLPLPGAGVDVAAGDVDGDGRSDLFVHLSFEPSGYAPNTGLAVLLQQPGGGFGAATVLARQSGLNTQRIAATDIDGDGRTDLLAHFTPFSSDFTGQLTAQLQGLQPLTWLARVDTPLGGVSGVDHTAFGDLDADGRPDVALVGTFPVGTPPPLSGPDIQSRVNLVMQTGGGQFTVAASHELPFRGGAVGIGDLNGDGRNDLALFGADGVVMLMRQSAVVAGSFESPRSIR